MARPWNDKQLLESFYWPVKVDRIGHNCVYQLILSHFTFAASQSSQVYYNTIAQLLSYRPSGADAPKCGPQIEVLIRLMSSLNGSIGAFGYEPGIQLALEQILIDAAKLDPDVVAQNLNVLHNLLALIRYDASRFSIIQF